MKGFQYSMLYRRRSYLYEKSAVVHYAGGDHTSMKSLQYSLFSEIDHTSMKSLQYSLLYRNRSYLYGKSAV